MSLPEPRADSALDHDPRRGAGDTPALVALPRRLTPFLGREELVARVVGRVTDPSVRLLTLTGPGGVGKTRLALHVAEVTRATFPDGTHFLSLAPVVDPALVLPSIGRVLGLGEGGERPIVERLTEAMTGRRMLLVMDNLEQVLPVAPDIARILRATDGVTVLATSRAPLHLDGEYELAIPPLALPSERSQRGVPVGETEAVRFFVERARAVRPGFALTTINEGAVREIVRRLDGLPLALELAAARTKVLSPEALLLRLERQLHVLTGGPQDRPERQRTMRDAIAWSYGLLDPTGQSAFRRLAVFRGGFSLEDADAVLSDSQSQCDMASAGIDVLDAVTALVAQSLVVAAESDDGGEVRFRMLETIREFGLEQLTASGEAEEVQRRFSEHWNELAQNTWRHTAELDGLNRALEPLDRNHDNIRAAMDWLEVHDPAGAATLAGGLSWFWYLRGHYAEALRRVQRLLALSESVIPPSLRPRLLLVAGWSSHFQSDPKAGARYLDAAYALFRDVGDEWGAGYTRLALGIIAEDSLKFDHARELFAEAVERLATAGDAASVATARYHLAVVAFGSGDPAGAEGFLDQVLGDRHGPAVRVAGWALHLRGLLASGRGDHVGALASQQEALRRFRDSRYSTGVCVALAGVSVAVAATRHAEAARFWAMAERMMQERGDEFQPPERTVYESAVAAMQERLGPTAFAAETTAGRAWSEDEAVTAALELDPDATPASTSVVGPLDVLSEREREVLRLVGHGWTNDRIAEELFLSPRTVQTHLTNIFRKIDVDNRTEAARLYVEAGLT